MDYLKIFFEFIKQHEDLAEFILICIFSLITLAYIYYFKPDFFQKIKDGFKSFFTAFKFAQKHKMIWLFAFLKIAIASSAVITFIILKKYNIITFDLLQRNSRDETIPPLYEIFLFLGAAFCSGYVASIIDCAAISYILKTLNKQKANVSNSFYNACSRARLIFKFFVIDWFITILTRNKQSESSRFNFVNAILKSIVGLAWSMATFFIMPVIAQEDISLKDSIHRSAIIMKKSFW